MPVSVVWAGRVATTQDRLVPAYPAPKWPAGLAPAVAAAFRHGTWLLFSGGGGGGGGEATARGRRVWGGGGGGGVFVAIEDDSGARGRRAGHHRPDPIRPPHQVQRQGQHSLGANRNGRLVSTHSTPDDAWQPTVRPNEHDRITPGTTTSPLAQRQQLMLCDWTHIRRRPWTSIKSDRRFRLPHREPHHAYPRHRITIGWGGGGGGGGRGAASGVTGFLSLMPQSAFIFRVVTITLAMVIIASGRGHALWAVRQQG